MSETERRCSWSPSTVRPRSLVGTPTEALRAGESPVCHSGLAGIGLVLAQRGREICEVDSMISGASAHACGLIRPGNKLLSVKGRDARSACMQDIFRQVIGQTGTLVELVSVVGVPFEIQSYP